MTDNQNDVVFHREKNIISRLRKLLYNYDLAINYAKGQKDLYEKKRLYYLNSSSKEKEKKAILAKIQVEKNEVYLQELESAKRELLDGIERVVGKYNDKYKKIFWMWFIEKKSYEQIVEETHYSYDAIRKITSKLRNELIPIFNFKLKYESDDNFLI